MDKLATPPPPASLRCRSIEYKTNARATGYVLLSWESHISSPQSFVVGSIYMKSLTFLDRACSFNRENEKGLLSLYPCWYHGSQSIRSFD